MQLQFLFLCLLLGTSEGLKFLVYNPLFGRSHVNFMGKLADVLVDAGHEVVMLAPVVNYKATSVGSTKVQKVIKVPPSPKSIEYTDVTADTTSSNMWRSQSFTTVWKTIGIFIDVWRDQCNATLNHPGLLDSLRAEHFDAAISEPMDKCGYGIFHYLGIKNVAASLSIAAFEGSFEVTGNPSFPSYVPGSMMGFGERMTFLQRVANTLSLSFGKLFIPYMSAPIEQLFRDKFGTDFPGIAELLGQSSLWFLNNEPLIEFPRPITHQIIDIGGISVSTGHSPLNETWSALLDLRPHSVLLSFGTVAKSSLMPDEYKQSIREVIKSFPDVTFIWKYEKPEHKISEGIENLFETTWVPQNDLLYDSRLSLFITHCGQGSTTEATTAGVPLIVIPVLADQKRNAAVIKRIDTGIVLEKEALERTKELADAINEVLENPKYRDNARAVGEMIRSRPFSPRETFVRNMEFLARFGPLRQLDHAGKELNFIQYYIIDVLIFLSAIAITIVCVVFRIAKLLLSLCFKSAKAKKE